ncbi:hypothetical protein [Halorubrum amylolyticum]|uniref:hypothetical protein n=1 Tax=Halorubrum amylolyticum TaxID=2508724 RepID=UPI0010092FDF|nr:hypothetical protein [Halorubrum amylolyticum]
MADSFSSVLGALRPRREHVLPFLLVGYVLGYAGVVWMSGWVPAWVTERTALAATPPLAYVTATIVVAVAPDRVPSPSGSQARWALAFCGLTVVAFEALRAGWGPSFRGLLLPIAVFGWPAAALVWIGILLTWSGPLPASGGLLLFGIGAAATGVWQFWLAGWVSRRIAGVRANRSADE